MSKGKVRPWNPDIDMEKEVKVNQRNSFTMEKAEKFLQNESPGMAIIDSFISEPLTIERLEKSHKDLKTLENISIISTAFLAGVLSLMSTYLLYEATLNLTSQPELVPALAFIGVGVGATAIGMRKMSLILSGKAGLLEIYSDMLNDLKKSVDVNLNKEQKIEANAQHLKTFQKTADNERQLEKERL